MTQRRHQRLGCMASLCLAVGCGGNADERRPQAVKADVASIATVIQVQWRTDKPTVGYAEFGPTRDLGSRTPLDPAPTTEHTATLLGLPASSACYFRVVSAEGGAVVASSDVSTIETGSLPVGLPQLNHTGDTFDGFLVVPILGAQKAVVVLDGQGQIVWYSTDLRDLEAYRALLSNDGHSVIFNTAKISGEPSPDSALVRVALDGSKTTVLPIPLLAHDFVELPDGTLGAMTFEDRQDADGSRVRGNALVEVATDSSTNVVWDSWDCFDPKTTPGDDPQQGWTFSNALDYDPVEDVYYVGLRNFSSIAKVDRKKRTCEWVLGTYGKTLEFADRSPAFLHEHQFDVQGNHVIVMDNDGAGQDRSRVTEYELDVGANTATVVWTYMPDPSVYTFVLGEPVRLATGNTVIDWSTAGQIEEVDPTGNRLWKLDSGVGVAFGFLTTAQSLY